jgi:hypothetical protein
LALLDIVVDQQTNSIAWLQDLNAAALATGTRVLGQA